jgi:hypothetical protein
VFGQPAFVARHVRGDAQSEALLAEQGVAAVAGTVGPDLAGLGVVHDVFGVGLHGQRESFSLGPSGAPIECTQGTYSPLVPSTSNTLAPMRVMVRMLTTT